MALRKSRLTLILICVMLFFALCAKPISSHRKDPAPSPTPSKDKDKESKKDCDTPGAAPSSGPSADSPLSVSELFELSMPEIGVQKSSTDQNNDGTKMVITQLEGIKQQSEWFKTWFAHKGSCPRLTPEVKKCCDQCQENVGDAVDGVQVSIESINKQDLPKANDDISNIANDLKTCYDCFVEAGNGEDKDLNNFNSWAQGATKECLNNLKKAEGGVEKLSADQNNDGTKMAITQLEDIKKRIEAFKTFLPAKQRCNLTPPEAKKCCDQCQENLDEAIDGVKVSIESINKQDLPKANVDISGIATDIQTCNDCFANGEDKDVRPFNWWAKGAVEECINSLKKAETGVQKLGVRKSSVDQNNDGTKMAITQLEDIKKRIEAFKTFLPAKKRCNLTPPEAKKCCDQCQENLDEAIDGVKVSIESINKQDLPKANVDISGIATDIQTCNDCFTNGEDKDVRPFNWWARGAVEECINSLKKEETGVQKLGVRKSSVDQNNDGAKVAITQVEVIKEKVEVFKKYLEAKNRCGRTPAEAKKCCDKCQENVNAAIDGVKVSMESINKQDLPKANDDISGIAKDIEKCNDCFTETGTGEDQHLKDYYSGVKEAIEECLNSLKNAEIGVQKSSVDQNNDDTKMTITQLEDIKTRLEGFKTYLPSKKKCNLTPVEAKKCCDTCQENLDDAIDGVKVSMESINKQDLPKANVDISGIATDIQTCNDCFVETPKGEDKDVKAFYLGIKGVTEECLQNLKKAEIGVQKSSVDQNNDGTKMTITQVEVIKERVEVFRKYLEAKKRCGRTPPAAKDCCDKCQENIDAAFDGVKVSMESINKQDLPKAKDDISGIAKDIETCNDCFIETGTGEDQHLKDYYSGVKEAIEECNNNLKTTEIGVQKSSIDQNKDGTKMTITQVEAIKERVEVFRKYLEAKKRCGRTPPAAKDCCDKCQENIDAAFDGVKVSMENINKQDLPKAKDDISGIAKDIETCNDCFIETGTGEDQHLKDYYSGVKEAIEECNNNLKTAEIGVQKSSVDQNNDDTKMTITQLEDIKKRLEGFKTYLPSKKKCNLTPVEAKKCCDTCQENLDDALDGVKVSMESINKQDLPKANDDISGIAKDVETCNGCFVETPKGEDKDVKSFYLGIKEVTEECLQNLKKAESGVQKSSVDQNNDGTKMTSTQLEGLEQRIEAFKTFLTSKKNCGLTPPEAKECCEQCQGNLDDAIDGVKVSMESINKQDLPKANTDISGIATDIQTCNDCFVEKGKGEDKDVKPFNLWVQGVTKECLDNLKKA